MGMFTTLFFSLSSLASLNNKKCSSEKICGTDEVLVVFGLLMFRCEGCVFGEGGDETVLMVELSVKVSGGWI